MMRADKPFDRTVIYHNDPESEEYEAIDAEYIDEIPTIDLFDIHKRIYLCSKMSHFPI